MPDCQDRPFVRQTILEAEYFDPLSQSIRVATLNALSAPLFSPERLGLEGLQCIAGPLVVSGFLLPGDTVALIDCAGSSSCRYIAEQMDALKCVYFCDSAWDSLFKASVARFLEATFGDSSKVGGVPWASREEACRLADVVVVSANTICTNSLDELLDFSKRLRRSVLVVGRSYGMDPVPLFRRGVDGVERSRLIQSKVVNSIRHELKEFKGGGAEIFKSWFAPQHIVRNSVSPSLGATVRTPGHC